MKRNLHDIHAILSDLEKNFMTMEQLATAGEAGELVIQKGPWAYDSQFQKMYPEHPMSSGRYTRIKAADTILSLSTEMKEPFQPDILDNLHISLFDCCAAVRLSIAKALYNGGNIDSIPYIQELIKCENESKMVLEQARDTLERLECLAK